MLKCPACDEKTIEYQKVNAIAFYKQKEFEVIVTLRVCKNCGTMPANLEEIKELDRQAAAQYYANND